MHAYLEGFTAVQDTSKIDVIQAFLNFLAEPAAVRRLRQHHRHGLRDAVGDAARSRRRSRRTRSWCRPPRCSAKTEFDKYLGADGTTLWSNTWERDQGGVARARRGAASADSAGGGASTRAASAPGAAAADARDHGGVLRRAAGADRALLVRVDQPGQLRRLLRLDDRQLPRVHVRRSTCTRSLRSVVLSVSATLVCARARIHASRTSSAASRPRAQRLLLVAVIVPVLDELHRAHLRVGRPAPEPRAARPVRPRARPATGTSTSSTRQYVDRASASSTRTCR